MIIKCYGERAFGGRTEDTFVVEGYSDLEELLKAAEQNLPIKCKEPTAYYKWNIIDSESLTERIVYLGNYLKIKEVENYIMNEQERKQIHNNVCRGCSFSGDSISAALKCAYSNNGQGGCANYEEGFSIRKLFRRSS